MCVTGVTNTSFHVGSARRLLKTFLDDGNILTDETVAVVNPNRNGLSKLKQFRRLDRRVRYKILGGEAVEGFSP